MTATGNEAVTLAQLRTATGSTGSGGATGGEPVRLRQLKMLRDSLTDDITARLATVNGVSGDVNAQLDTLDGTKTAIKDAIIAKGVEVPEGTVFRDYAGKIGEISGGPDTVTLEILNSGNGSVYLHDADSGEFRQSNINETVSVYRNSIVVVYRNAPFSSASISPSSNKFVTTGLYDLVTAASDTTINIM